MMPEAQVAPEAGTSMDRIRKLAVLSVRRACAFAGLAIGTVMVGLITDPPLAFRAAAILTAITAAVLFYKAFEAPRRNHRETELWFLLDRDPGLPEAFAGRVINNVLREVYLQHARMAVAIAGGLWLFAVIDTYAI
jgi:hypothetical protein